MPKKQIALLVGAIALSLLFLLTECTRRAQLDRAADQLSETLQEYKRNKCESLRVEKSPDYDKKCRQ